MVKRCEGFTAETSIAQIISRLPEARALPSYGLITRNHKSRIVPVLCFIDSDLRRASQAASGFLLQCLFSVGNMSLTLLFQAQLLNLARQGVAPDAKQCCRFDASTAGMMQGLQDQSTLKLQGKGIHDAFVAALQG